jgi:hypothetical protein
MDNIQKLILGVLGIAGMLVILVPSQIDVAPQRPPAVAASGTPAPPPVMPQDGNENGNDGEQSVEESDFENEDIFLTGEPAIDGNPDQGPQNYPNNVQQPQTDQYSAPQNYDYNQPVGISGFASPQPNQAPTGTPQQQDVPAY